MIEINTEVLTAIIASLYGGYKTFQKFFIKLKRNNNNYVKTSKFFEIINPQMMSLLDLEVKVRHLHKCLEDNIETLREDNLDLKKEINDLSVYIKETLK